MNRTWIIAPLLAAATLFGSNPAAAQVVPKVGYVNSQRILAEAPATTEAQRTLEAELQRYRTEVERLEKDLETMQTEYERQAATLTAEARQQRQQEFQQKFQTAQQRVMQLEQQAQQKRQELIAPIMQRVSEVIETLRKEQNYTLIVDAGALLAADPAYDLTDEVLARLQPAAGDD